MKKSSGGDLGFSGLAKGRWISFAALIRYLKLLKRKWGFARIKFRVWVMLLAFHIAPRSAYRFSMLKNIPSKAHRIPKTDNPLDEFEIHRDLSTDIPELDSINIVMRGVSFDRSLLSELMGPTFVINWMSEKAGGENFIYTTGGGWAALLYPECGMSPVWCVDHIWVNPDGSIEDLPHTPEIDRIFLEPSNTRIAVSHRLNHPNPSSGSGVICVVALCKLAKEVNIYGWDHYLTSGLAKRSYWRTLLGMLAFDGSRTTSAVVEMAMYGWHYAYRISQLPHVTVHGYLEELGDHPNILKKLDKVFYELLARCGSKPTSAI